MVILTLNCGSSSVKYQLYDWRKRLVIAKGVVERVNTHNSFIKHETLGKDECTADVPCPTHREAIKLVTSFLLDPEHGAIGDLSAITAVGHRVVHGADRFSKSTVIDASVLSIFREVSDLSPLHNPANIMGIEAAQAVLRDIPHCAVMDTAWHQTMPARAYIYALPFEWYRDYHVRKYGFHGTSLLYVAKRAAVLLGKDPKDTNLILLHIGNGVSANAVAGGISVDTSMGLTPLEGLVMGTRSGDIDPAIPFFIMNKTGLSANEVENILNKKSGILGITEKYIDRRDVVAAAERGEEQARLAIEIEAYRLKKYIGSYAAALGTVDALVFTAGVGEMNPHIRARCLEGLAPLGFIVDLEKNELSRTRNAETVISADRSPVKIFVIPTDEEIVMTEDTVALIEGHYDVHTHFSYTFQKPDYCNIMREEGLRSELEKNPKLKSILAFSR
ncbi:MAG: acetate kinase [Spirochaetales bacterium]|nr:acetate kinase [Spirochaetales bacterium]